MYRYRGLIPFFDIGKLENVPKDDVIINQTFKRLFEGSAHCKSQKKEDFEIKKKSRFKFIWHRCRKFV